MSIRCDICGKGKIYGISRTHKRGVAGGQWKKKAPKTQKIFKPNLHYAWIPTESGKKVRMRLCTKCLRAIKKGLNKSPKKTSTEIVEQQAPVMASTK